MTKPDTAAQPCGQPPALLWESLLHQVQIDFYTARLHRCGPDWRIVRRTIRDEMMHVVHQGAIRWRIGESSFESGAGSIVFCPPELEWGAEVSSAGPVHLSVLHFDAHFPGGQRYLETLGYGYHIIPDQFKRLETMVRTLNRVYAGAEPGHSLRERALLLGIFHELFPYRARSPVIGGHGEQVLKIIGFLQENLREEVTREVLARKFHLSSGHLAAVFKQYTGDSPIGYLLRLRMEQAIRLLVSTALPVGEIARQVGYEDAAYFSRLFKQHTGFSPQNYRFEQQHL